MTRNIKRSAGLLGALCFAALATPHDAYAYQGFSAFECHVAQHDWPHVIASAGNGLEINQATPARARWWSRAHYRTRVRTSRASSSPASTATTRTMPSGGSSGCEAARARPPTGPLAVSRSLRWMFRRPPSQARGSSRCHRTCWYGSTRLYREARAQLRGPGPSRDGPPCHAHLQHELRHARPAARRARS